MRKFKQLVAMIIAVATIASLLTFSVTSVSAEETLPQITITEDDFLLIEKLEALGVITNEYTASSYVTRREMAEIIKTYMGLSATSSGSGDNQFDDVTTSDPSYGTISALRDLEVITGDENNNFYPDNYLNYNEAVVFIINAVGHKYFATREGGYPTGYMRMAIKFDMLEDLYMTDGNSNVPVIDVYRMLDKALDAATIITQYYGDGSVRYTISETDTFLSETYGIYKYRGQVTGNEFTNITSSKLDIEREQIEINNVIYDTPGYYYSYFLGYTVDYYVKHSSTDEDELVYVEETPKRNSTISLDAEEIRTSKVTSSRIYYLEDGKEKEDYIDLDSVVDVIYNNQSYKGYGALKNIMPKNGYVEALDNDSDGIYEVLFIYDYRIVVVDSVDSYDEIIYDKLADSNQGEDPKINLATNVRKVDIVSAKSGASVPFASIQKGDVLNIAIGQGTEKVITIYVCDEKVTGKITGYNSNSGYLIEETYYKKTDSYDKEVNSQRVFPELKVGLSGTFYLDKSGKIAAHKYEATDDASMLAVMAGIDYKPGSTLNNDVNVKLFTSEGEFLVAPLSENVKIDNGKYNLSTQQDTVLNELSKGYKENNETYKVNDAYVVRYTLSKEGEITFIDTGDVGGAGNLNPFADHYLVSVTRLNVALFAPDSTDITGNGTFAGVSSDVLVFKTPLAGQLDRESDYSVSSGWYSDHSYANPSHVNSNFSGSNTSLMDNLTAYHTGENDSIMLRAVVIRGAGVSAGVSDDSGFCVVTEIADSVNADGVATKTLYENDQKIGQLADVINVAKDTVTTPYSIEAFLQANILKEGTVIRCGMDNDGYISEVSVVSNYVFDTQENKWKIVPAFNGPDTYVGSTAMYSVAKANFAVGEAGVYDNKNSFLNFSCGTYDYLGITNYIESVKIYDTTTKKVRNASISDIREGDQCVFRVKLYYRIHDIIIFR